VELDWTIDTTLHRHRLVLPHLFLIYSWI
jgi:hypothetical protein